MSELINAFMLDYYANGTHQRLGQYFVNTYIKVADDSTSAMFYEEDINKARVLVSQFMGDNQWYELPKKLDNIEPTASRFIDKE